MFFKLISIMKFLYSGFYSKIRNPKEIRYILSIFKKEKLLKFIEKEALIAGLGLSWKRYNSNNNFIKRYYKSFDDYIEHQKSKYEKIKDNLFKIEEYDKKFRRVLRARLNNLNIIQPSMKVLCLGARYGSEVKTFLELGNFAVGIDLNPGEENEYVLFGNFHNIQFPSNSVDVIYTNSLDHAFDINDIIKEIRRVLSPDGFLILEAVIGINKKRYPGYYESFWWSKVEDLITIFTDNSFDLMCRSSFSFPWNGEQYLFKKKIEH